MHSGLVHVHSDSASYPWTFDPRKDYGMGAGLTVEMHGSIRQLVCPECGAVSLMTPQLHRMLRSQIPIPCATCGEAALRCRVMLYDDAEGTQRSTGLRPGHRGGCNLSSCMSSPSASN